MMCATSSQPAGSAGSAGSFYLYSRNQKLDQYLCNGGSNTLQTRQNLCKSASSLGIGPNTDPAAGPTAHRDVKPSAHRPRNSAGDLKARGSR